MKSFCFSFGDSSHGPVGAVIRVKAEDEASALVVARDALDQFSDGCDEETRIDGVEYLRVYFNAEALTLQDLDGDEEEELDGEVESALLGTAGPLSAVDKICGKEKSK